MGFVFELEKNFKQEMASVVPVMRFSVSTNDIGRSIMFVLFERFSCEASVVLRLFTCLLIFFPAGFASADQIFFDDFESYTVGSTLGDNGYFSALGNMISETIDNSGVNGSQGFDVDPIFGPDRGRPNGIGHFSANHVFQSGERLTAQVQTQFVFSAAPGELEFGIARVASVGINVFNSGLPGMEAGLVLTGENFETYSIFIGAFDEPFRLAPNRPVSELGLQYGEPFSLSDVLTVEVSVFNNPEAIFLSGRIGNNDGFFAEYGFATSAQGGNFTNVNYWTTLVTGDAGNELPEAVSQIAFDNFGLSQSIPEPCSILLSVPLFLYRLGRRHKR